MDRRALVRASLGEARSLATQGWPIEQAARIAVRRRIPLSGGLGDDAADYRGRIDRLKSLEDRGRAVGIRFEIPDQPTAEYVKDLEAAIRQREENRSISFPSAKATPANMPYIGRQDRLRILEPEGKAVGIKVEIPSEPSSEHVKDLENRIRREQGKPVKEEARKNRLSDLRLDSILGRRSIWFHQTYSKSRPPTSSGAAVKIHPDEFQKLIEIARDPSKEEIEDLGLIDALFGPLLPGDPFYGDALCWSFDRFKALIPKDQTLPSSVETALRTGKVRDPIEFLSEALQVPINREFICPPWPKDVPKENPGMQAGVASGNTLLERRQLWGVAFGVPRSSTAIPTVHGYLWNATTGDRWGSWKPRVKDMIFLESWIAKYPFPKPFDKELARYWGFFAADDLRLLLSQPGAKLDDTIVRTWITMSVLKNLEKMAKKYEEDLAATAERKKFKATMMKISFAVFGALLAITGVSVLVSKGFIALGQTMSALDQKRAAESLASAYDGFRESDPLFAKEVGLLMGLMQFLPGAAAAAAAAKPRQVDYALVVEGRTVIVSRDPEEVARAVDANTEIGDRFEIFEGSRSTGLKIRLSSGIFSVPPEEEARVRAMTRGEVRAMVEKAERSAKGKEGGVPWWLVAGGAAAAIAAVAAGAS